jgi:hypothetical protein
MSPAQGGRRARGVPSGRVMLAALGALLSSAAPGRADAQTLAERVERVGDGTVLLSYATRPDVCGDGAGTIGRGKRERTTRWSSDDDGRGTWSSGDCVPGPARLTLAVEDGRVRRVRVSVGGTPRAAAGTTDLGTIAAPAAAAYLLALAERSDGQAGREAVFAAALADSAVVWPRLLGIARDAGRPAATRREATFWVGEAAGEQVAPDADDDASGEAEVRAQAVFALSQRPRDESVPALIRVARTNRDAAMRRRALFWLGQSNDPRALDEFEAVLRRR